METAPHQVEVPAGDGIEAAGVERDATHGWKGSDPLAEGWTKDITRAHRFAKSIHAGTVWINTFNMFNAASPFGGFKQSGYGREMGKHALEMYTQVKSVWVDLSGKPIGWFGT